MSHDDDPDEREERTVELSGIELRALRESAELTALTRSSVEKKKANPTGLEEGTVPKNIPDADEASTKDGRDEDPGDVKHKDPETKEIPVLVDEPPDPADVSDPTRSIDRSSLKEMIKTEVRQSGAWENKSGIFRKSTLLAEKGKESATSNASGDAEAVPMPSPEPTNDGVSFDVDEDLDTDDALFEALEEVEKEDPTHADESDASAEDTEHARGVTVEGEEHPAPEADGEQEDIAVDADPDISSVDLEPEPAAPPKPSPPSETAEIEVSSSVESSLEEADKPKKKLGFGGVVVGLFLALAGGGAALMIPAFQAIGIAAALSGVVLTFISALGMRE